MAAITVIIVPFSGSVLSVLARQPRCRNLQADALAANPVAEQLQKRLLEKDRAATNAAQKCSYCCHGMLLGLLRRAKAYCDMQKAPCATCEGKYGGVGRRLIQIAPRLSRS